LYNSGLTHGAQKPGFLPNLPTTTRLLVKTRFLNTRGSRTKFTIDQNQILIVVVEIRSEVISQWIR